MSRDVLKQKCGSKYNLTPRWISIMYLNQGAHFRTLIDEYEVFDSFSDYVVGKKNF